MRKIGFTVLIILLSFTLVLPAMAETAGEQDISNMKAKRIKDGIAFYPKDKLADIRTYTVYYGEGEIEVMKQFDLAILETASQTKEGIRELTKSGTKTIAYISIGEADPGTWYYPYVDENWKLGSNENWDSDFIDVRHQGWHDLILDKMIPHIIGYGVQGLFLDTVDSVDVEPEMTDAMIALIRDIRERYPELIIVMNRGLTIMDEAIPYIDGLMFESFSVDVDWDTVDWDTIPPKAVYSKWTGDEELWTADTARRLGEWQRRTGLTVLALDYANPDETDSIQYAYDRATSFGMELWDFVPYVSTLDLHHIYTHEIDYTRNDAFRDSDGDGVVDADERKAGLDPTTPFTYNRGIPDLGVYGALQVKQWAEHRLALIQKERMNGFGRVREEQAPLIQIINQMKSFIRYPQSETIVSAQTALQLYQVASSPDPEINRMMVQLNDLLWMLK